MESGNVSESPSTLLSTEEYLEGKIDNSLQTNEEDIKNYLQDLLIPLLSHGIDELEKLRPKDPITFLAHFLLKHKPVKSEN